MPISADSGRTSADLVIIGGGGSGLAAAVRAREVGVEKVVVLEKTARPGGNAWIAVVMLGLGDPLELKPDMTEWSDAAFSAMMEFGEWTLDPKVIRAFVDTYPSVVRWLIDKGIEFDVHGFPLGGRKNSILALNERRGDFHVNDPARGPGFLGSVVTDLMLEHGSSLGVDVRTRTKATRILLDGRTVRGVEVAGPDGEYTIDAPNVVVAAGGFGANDEMMRRYFPEHFVEGAPNTLCLGGSTGDGLALAEEIGLLMGEDMDPGIIGPGHHPWSHSLHEALLRPEVAWVNTRAERFIDETLTFRAGSCLARQPGAILYALFDSAVKEHIQANPTPRQIDMHGEDWLRTVDEDVRKEAKWKRTTAAVADSWDELAARLGLDADTLRATVDRYNEHCRQGRDADFVKDPQFLLPLQTPPFYAVLGKRFCHGTGGGIKIGADMGVTDRQGERIEGLYATGDNTSGWVTEWGLPGTTLAFAFTSGWLAGESAGRDAAARRGAAGGVTSTGTTTGP